MALRDKKALRVILYEGPGAETLTDKDRFSALSTLLERGHSVTRTSGTRAVSPSDGASTLVLGRFTQTPDFSCG